MSISTKAKGGVWNTKTTRTGRVSFGGGICSRRRETPSARILGRTELKKIAPTSSASSAIHSIRRCWQESSKSKNFLLKAHWKLSEVVVSLKVKCPTCRQEVE